MLSPKKQNTESSVSQLGAPLTRKSKTRTNVRPSPRSQNLQIFFTFQRRKISKYFFNLSLRKISKSFFGSFYLFLTRFFSLYHSNNSSHMPSHSKISSSYSQSKDSTSGISAFSSTFSLSILKYPHTPCNTRHRYH